MDWESMRFVLAIARAGTLSGAADALGVVRTTVGRRLQGAEEELGVRLFDRTPDGYVPTPAGQDLAESAARVEEELMAAESRILGRDVDLQGKLRLATVDFVFEGFVEVFSSFVTRYPSVELTVCSSYEEVSLRRREADVAVRLNDTPAPHLVGRKLGKIEFGIFGARSLVESVGADAPLGAYPWIRPDERSDDGSMDAWLEENAPGARTTMRFDSYPTIRTALRAGIGIHLLACIDGERDPELVELGKDLPRMKRTLWVLTLPELRTNSRVRAFTDHVYEAFRERLGPIQ